MDPRDSALNYMERRPPPPKRSPSIHNGLAIVAFLASFFVPPIGVILGCVSVNEAHKSNRHESGLAVWAIILGILGTVIYIIVIAVAIHSADQAANQLNNLQSCNVNNPAWPYC